MPFKSLPDLTAGDISRTGVQPDEAERIQKALSLILRRSGGSPPATWMAISKNLLNPNHPFALHQMMYYGCYKDFESANPPAWMPDKDTAALTNVGQVLEKHGREFLGFKYRDVISSFSDFQKFSVESPEAYWKLVLEEMKISFSVPPSCIVHESSSYPGGQWLPGAFTNSAGNCLNLNDRRGLDDVAVIWRDEGCDDLPVQRMTLKELRKQVWLVANALDTLNFGKGSAFAINMPMTVNAVIIYLAIIVSGYVVVSIADSFAPAEISTRLKISNAKVVFTQDFILRGSKELPLYSKVVEANAHSAIVLPIRGTTVKDLRDSDLSWYDLLERVKSNKEESYGEKDYPAVEQPIEAFTNILFSSGTTGKPKAIPWTHATPIKAAADAWAHMDIHKGDVVAWPTNLGWMMGPWLVYASLLNDATIALYNGSPLGSGFAKFVQDAKVTMLGIVPSIVRSWKNTNCTHGFDWSAIRCFSSTGEASTVDEYLWLMGRAHYKPVIEYCGGTELGGGFVTGSLLQAQALSAFTTPAMGCKLFILGSDGNPLDENVPAIGEVALYPTMLGASATLLNANHYDVYFRGMPVWNGKTLRRHGDEFERTADGYYRAHGRADDTMNLGGIKVSSIEIERICNGVNDAILETAAIGLPPLKGGPEQLVIVVVFKERRSLEGNLDQLRAAFNSELQKKLNPLFKVSCVVVLPSLPRTASNKVMRRVLRQQFLKRSNL